MVDIQNLKDHRVDLLKAEIATLLFNLGKTHIGFWKEKKDKNTEKIYQDFSLDEIQFEKQFGYKPFTGYRDYYNSKNTKAPFEIDISTLAPELMSFIIKQTIHDPLNTDLLWQDCFKGDDSSNVLFKKVMFRGCESVNSGIDKGALPDSQQIIGELYLSNAFGTHKENVGQQWFDEKRLDFFKILHQEMTYRNWYNSPDWSAIRNFIVDKIKSWYSHLLSDSRFPANDVTLWDQVYMTASMFKAVLAEMYLGLHQADHVQNPQKIQWQIFGVQYDKLALTEKGLKPAFIKWYSNAVSKIDDAIKAYLENDLAIANEIYRDETGIYFLFPNHSGMDFMSNSKKQVLTDDLKFIEKKILEIFANELPDELTPVFFLTKPCRGLMNLTQLVTDAKDNFLYAPFFINRSGISNKGSDPETYALKENSPAYPQICQVCRVRMAESDKAEDELHLCGICKKRKEGRLSNWLTNPNQETIWLDELQDKNNRIALITLRFELKEWLNGNLLSTTVNRKDNFNGKLNCLKELINSIRDYQKRFEGNTNNKNLLEFIGFYGNNKNLLDSYLDLFDEGGVKTPFDDVISKAENLLSKPNRSEKEQESIDMLNRFWFEFFKSNFAKLIEKTVNGNKILNKKSITILDSDNLSLDKNSYDTFKKYYNNNGNNVGYKDIFAFSYLTDNIIGGLFLDRSHGTEWQELIKKKTGIANTIDWANLTDFQIDEMSSILLQFLLRKNPSPARLRRIWDTTQSFLNNLENQVGEILEKKRIIFQLPEGHNLSEGDLEEGALHFWISGNQAYLITALDNVKEFLKRTGISRDEIVEQIDLGKTDWFRTNIKIGDCPIDPRDAHYEKFTALFAINAPTPVSWQFIVPADTVPGIIEKVRVKSPHQNPTDKKPVPGIIEKVRDSYQTEFKYVNGKLPLHIGVVVQNYKAPLYVGLKALRNIRRELNTWDDIKTTVSEDEIKKRLQDKENKAEIENKAVDYYALFQHKGAGEYSFYFPPEDSPVSVSKLDSGKDYRYYPNTFDFEFLDSNARRNDIFYKDGKRTTPWREKRPYDWRDWPRFEAFRKLFGAKESNQLHNLITLLFSLMEENRETDESKVNLLKLAASAIINTLKPKNMEKEHKDWFDAIFGILDWKSLHNELTKEKIQEFIDMYDFWHKTLKEV